jgi:hypothetical protein
MYMYIDYCNNYNLDILLHQSGHIMLTDFDLSKGSSPPGRPGIVKSRSSNQVSFKCTDLVHVYMT